MTSTMEKASRLLMIISILTNLTLITINEAATVDVAKLSKVGDASILNCALTEDCDYTPLPSESYKPKRKGDWSSLGLSSTSLQINGISLGFVPAFEAKIGSNTPAEINKKLFKPMSIVGDYISLSSSDPDMKAIDWHLPIIKALEGNPVWCITLMPSEGLESVTWQVAQKIANKMAWVNKQGIVVWLKWTYEMNGMWNNWGMKPELFKEKWHLVAKAVKSTASSTYMLWSPNIRFGDSVWDKRGGYMPYWPAAWSVDIAGVSFYHWGVKSKRVNVAPTQAEAVPQLIEFANIFGPKGWGKPIVVSETAACYTYYEGTNIPVEGGVDEIKIKMTWLHLLLDAYIKKLVPALQAVIWFEILKKENATGNTPMRTEDFRLVMGNPDLANKVRQLFASYLYREEKQLRKRLLD